MVTPSALRSHGSHPFDADHDPGTPESVWQGDGRRYPPLDMSGCTRIVVVAPHPDDEILGVGGLVRHAAADGIEVVVVAVTDGAASHPGSPTVTPEDLLRVRPLESDRALEHLGISSSTVRLGIEDGGVRARESELADAVAALLSAGTWCLASWRGDGHPDHEATGRACAVAAAATGAVLVEYPIWMWHWASPDHGDVPWHRARSVTLPAETQEAKAAAIAEFTTQVTAVSEHPADRAVLPPHVLARLTRSFEVVFV